MGVLPKNLHTQICDLHFLTYKTTLEFIHYLYGEIEEVIDQASFKADELDEIIRSLNLSYGTLQELLERSEVISNRITHTVHQQEDHAIIAHLEVGKAYLQSRSFSRLNLDSQKTYLLDELNDLRAFLKQRIELLNFNL